MTANGEKQLAAVAAAELVHDGMVVGLGTGTTVAFLLTALAARQLRATFVATSPATAKTARTLGLEVREFSDIARLDLAIDGADQIAPDWWLVKGGGGAHAREKMVAASADRFVVIADSSKLVPRLSPPVPLELATFALAATMTRLGHVTLRDVPLSPDGGVIADYHGAFDSPSELATTLATTPGVLAHGLFAPVLSHDVLVGVGDTVQRRTKE